MWINSDEIIKLMKEGWKLGLSNGVRKWKYWLLKNGLCRGDMTIYVLPKTVISLQKKNIIEI